MPQPRRERMHPDIGTRLDSLAGDPLEILLRGGPEPSEDQALAVAVASIDRARPAWHEHAACREPEHADVDFTSRTASVQSRALQVCGGCSQRVTCLEWAIEVGDAGAVLGGMTPAARKAHARADAARQRKTVNEP